MKTHLGAICLSVAILVASLILACSQRYSVYRDGSMNMRLDHWTGKVEPAN